MATLQEQVNLLIGLGYKRLAAQAKVAHDVVLLAMEKLLSLLRHGIVSRRPKDVFDMYYLSPRLNRNVLRTYMASLIYASTRCKERSKEEVLDSLHRTFSSKRYLSKLGSARVNWIGVSPKVATSTVAEFIASI